MEPTIKVLRSTNKKIAEEDEPLFTIDNTKDIIMMDIFWYIFAIFFMSVLWVLVLNLEQNIGKTSQELFLQEIHDPRFSSILFILIIVGPTQTFFSIRKHLNQDKHIYFYNNRIEYQNRVVELNEVEWIKTGFYPLKAGLIGKSLVFILGFWFIFLLYLFNILWFILLKFLSLNNVNNKLNRFLIVIKNENKSILGSIYSTEEMANLKKFIADKGINSGR